MKKVFFGVIISLIIIFGFIFFVAQYALPDWSGFYQVKRFEEKILFSFQSTDSEKATFMQSLLEKRLSELQGVVNNEDYDIFYSTSLRYSTQAGDLTDFINKKNLKDERKSTLVLFNKQQRDIKKLLQNKDTHDQWKFIQDANNYLTIYSAKLSK